MQREITPDWAAPVQISSGMAAYKEEVLVASSAIDIEEEQRIFIENKQKYCKVKIGVNTRARDVLASVSATGQLVGPNSDERAIGGWMLYEMAVDFGMGEYCRCVTLFIIACGLMLRYLYLRAADTRIRAYLGCVHDLE